MTPQEVVREFDWKHGGLSSAVIVGPGTGSIYFPDGSVRANTAWGGMTHAEDLSAYERCKNRKTHAETLLKRATFAFDQLKQQLKILAKQGCTPSDSELERLKELQKAVRQAKRTLKMVNTDLAATPEMKAMEERRKRDADSRATSERFLQKLNEIEV